MTWLIGLTGYAQHGKDTVGELLGQYGFEKAAFANALRFAVWTLDPIVGFGPDGEEFRYSEALDELGYEEAKKLPEVRRLLQVMGTEVVRDILGENAWVQALDNSLDTANRYAITDVRFPNEAAFIQANGGVLVRVTRPGFDSGVDRSHPSEQYIEKMDADVELVAHDMRELELGVKALAYTLRLPGAPDKAGDAW